MFGLKKKKQKGLGRTTQISLIIFVLIIAFLVALWGWNMTDKTLKRTQAESYQQMMASSCDDLSTEAGREECESALDEVSSAVDEYRQELQEAR